jgi:hypothetical protein
VVGELNNREMGVKWAPRVFLVARLTWRFNDCYAYSCKLTPGRQFIGSSSRRVYHSDFHPHSTFYQSSSYENQHSLHVQATAASARDSSARTPVLR